MYITVDNGLTWTQQQKLLASDGAAGDNFGLSVAVYNNTIVAGASYDDNVRGVNAGNLQICILCSVCT